MKRIIIDLDDVIVNQDGWLYVVNEFLNTNYTIDDVKGYYIQDLVPEEKKKEFTKFFVKYDTYKYSGIFENAVNVIKKLNEKYEIYICSAYVFRDDYLYSADALKYKFEFLYKNFPFIDPNRFIFHTNKSIINCDIRIDDKVDNLKNAETKLLYTAYHNKNISDKELEEKGITRVNNWIDIEKILL